MSKLIRLPLLLVLVLSGCSLLSTNSVPVKQSPFKISEADQKSQLLYSHYMSWKGVPHLDGGMDRNGIDCSGFVHMTFKELFNKSVPRTTELLSDSGHEIDRSAVKTGDLVFFKTGFKRRHVGIYMGQNKFVHASGSRGVMISDLNNPYWAEAYWQVRRLN